MSVLQIFGSQIGTGLDESLTVERHTSVQPARIGNRARHCENKLDVSHLDAQRLTVAPRHSLKMVTSFESDNFSVGAQLDLRALFDTSNQISRHALSQSARSHQHVN